MLNIVNTQTSVAEIWGNRNANLGSHPYSSLPIFGGELSSGAWPAEQGYDPDNLYEYTRALERYFTFFVLGARAENNWGGFNNRNIRGEIEHIGGIPTEDFVYPPTPEVLLSQATHLGDLYTLLGKGRFFESTTIQDYLHLTKLFYTNWLQQGGPDNLALDSIFNKHKYKFTPPFVVRVAYPVNYLDEEFSLLFNVDVPPAFQEIRGDNIYLLNFSASIDPEFDYFRKFMQQIAFIACLQHSYGNFEDYTYLPVSLTELDFIIGFPNLYAISLASERNSLSTFFRFYRKYSSSPATYHWQNTTGLNQLMARTLASKSLEKPRKKK